MVDKEFSNPIVENDCMTDKEDLKVALEDLDS